LSALGRRTILAGLAALLAGGALAAVVAAHTDRYDTAININASPNADYFYGALTSEKGACEPKRKIDLYRERGGPDKLVDESRSIDNVDNATWTIAVTGTTTAFQDGTYYSKARKRDLSPGSAHAHICDGAKSGRVNIAQ
jgi:hypothetical protein